MAKEYKPTGKEYVFKTLKEITDQLTLDQVDNFVKDFGLWLRLEKGDYSADPSVNMLSKYMMTIGTMLGYKKEEIMKPGRPGEFHWKDDGEHQVSKINIEVEYGAPPKSV